MEYPQKLRINENILSSYLIPEGSHYIMNDCFCFVLKKNSEDILIESMKKQVDTFNLGYIKYIDLGSFPDYTSFGIVYLGLYASKQVALKEVELNQGESKELILKEIRFLMSLRHPSIINGYGYYERKQRQFGQEVKIIGLVTDCYLKGSLFHRNFNSSPSIHIKIKWLCQIACALDYLHSQNKLHRDMKPEYIFISESDDAVLGDFGLSRNFCSSSMRSLAGTFQWMAPEVICNSSYNSSVDVYSFGIIMYEVLFNKRPYKQEQYENMQEFFEKVVNGSLRPNTSEICNSDVSQHLITLMTLCWSSRSEEMPSLDFIINALNQI